jgi:hypothetical protein
VPRVHEILEARVWPLIPLAYESRRNRIEVIVAGEMKQVGILRNQLGLKPPLEQASVALVAFVDCTGVRHPELLHRDGKLPTDDFHQEVVVIWHQAEGEEDCSIGGEIVSHATEEELVILALREDRSTCKASVVDVMVVAKSQGDCSSGHCPPEVN